jgi:hypothetical protein
MALSLSELAARYQAAKAAKDAAEAKQKDLGKRIIARLDRSDTRTTTTKGKKITKVVRRVVKYSDREAELMVQEGELSKRMYQRITTRHIDKDKLLAEVSSGNITPEQLDRISYEEEQAPYVLVSEDD